MIIPRFYLFILASVAFIGIWFLSYKPFLYQQLSVSQSTDGGRSLPLNHSLPPLEAAGNETLGFQKILILSTGPSWRTRGLLAAAHLTGLQITIPPQPPIDEAIVDAFGQLGGDDDDEEHPPHGATIAWLAHLDLIKHAIQLDLETVLIIEDDVDWDVSIRHQMVRIASAIRNLTHTEQRDQSSHPTPYGHDWDLLWIGHCGEFWNEDFETVSFEDRSACPKAQYSGWARNYLSHLPDHHRSIYWSFNPVCSFAYALSRKGMRNVLRVAGGGRGEAFDVKVMQACKAKALRCISVVPEVVHQYFPAASYGVNSLVDIGNGEAVGPDETEFESVMGSTDNILESARCNALWGKTCLR
ncbi:hypothetical protein ASPZODRAFT_1970012, partial [Penicilliopsis zonata CBS 506.65]